MGVISRYSGSDIAVVVREALMQPIRKVQCATHFKWVSGPDRNDPKTMKPHLTPCSPGDSEAIEKSWTDVDGDQLMEPDLGMPDFIKAISTSRPTVNQSDLEQQVKFTQEFGQEG